jgi:hypothetical protein
MHKFRSKLSRPKETGPRSSLWGKLVGRSRPKQDEGPNQPPENDSAQALNSELESILDSGDSIDPKDLCVRAEQSLNEDNKTKHMWQSYLGILKDDIPQLEKNATGDRQKQLAQLLDAKTKELEARRTKIEFGDYELKIRNTLTKIFKTILFTKDLINFAAAPSPPAHLACAGVFVVLSVSPPFMSLPVTIYFASCTGSSYVVLTLIQASRSSRRSAGKSHQRPRGHRCIDMSPLRCRGSVSKEIKVVTSRPKQRNIVQTKI